MSTWYRLIGLACLCVCSVSVDLGTQDPFVVALFELVSKEQVQEDQPYIPLVSWQKIKGDYSGYIAFNVNGKPPMTWVRQHVRIYDNNMYVTEKVTLTLLEAVQYGRAPRPSHKQLTMTIETLKDYHNKNEPYNTSLMSIWQQRLNESTNYWDMNPVNLILEDMSSRAPLARLRRERCNLLPERLREEVEQDLGQDILLNPEDGFSGSLEIYSLLNVLPLDLIESFLRVAGLEEVVNYLESDILEKSLLMRVGRGCTDFDDVFVNVALGSALFQQKSEFSAAWELWNSQNTNLTSVFDALKKYAYRPFSDDSNVNSIDPRTYFYIRGYLDQAKINGQDVAIVSTFAQNIAEESKFDHGVSMPLQVNNIDVSMAANTIFGITSAVLSGLVSPDVLEDPLIAQIYENTTSLIAYEILNNFSSRPDLAIVYYLSRMQFYMFVANSLDILESARRNRSLPVKVMDTVYTTLRDVIDNHMTKNILSMANKEGADQVYFDDFLGDGDLTDDGRPLIRGEDRIITTAMAANALLSSWTYYDVISGKNYWLEETPEEVMETVAGCIKWLRHHTLEGKYDTGNAMFSLSTKGDQSLLFWYPANRIEYLNGTAITDTSSIPNMPFIYAVQGYVPAHQYNVMLKEKHFGHTTPMTFNGYNDSSSYSLFWSSDAYTYSTTLLAVSRFDNLVV